MLAVGCDGLTTVALHASSTSGTPLVGATVRIRNAPAQTTCITESGGSCSLRFMHGGWYNRYVVQFSKSGFKEVETRIWAGSTLECIATLAAVAESQPSLAECK
jgi:hypothetical protein